MLFSLVLSFLAFFNGGPTQPASWPPKIRVVKAVPTGEIGADDYSHAAPDGPLVFHRNGQVLVKSIVRRDTILVPSAATFPTPTAAAPALNCHVESTGDRFSFRLRERLNVQPDEYAMPDKMLVISDIEGNFAGFKMLLQGTGVMDKDFSWSFGTGHLALIGDFFDRGLNVTEVLWLIYKLEAEAEAAGGKIHFIIGNHEVLNLEGNTQYVRNKYLENADLLDEPYGRWYAPDSELGRWLRTKNAIERIGDVAFCHGGISEEMYASGLSIRRVNETARELLGKPFSAIEGFSGRTVFDTKTGIFWYRGIAKKQVSEEHVTNALAWAGAQRLVLGHTLMPDVTAIYSGRVFCIDLYHDENLRQGFMRSLWVENGAFYGINDRGEKSAVFNISYTK